MSDRLSIGDFITTPPKKCQLVYFSWRASLFFIFYSSGEGSLNSFMRCLQVIHSRKTEKPNENQTDSAAGMAIGSTDEWSS